MNDEESMAQLKNIYRSMRFEFSGTQEKCLEKEKCWKRKKCFSGKKCFGGTQEKVLVPRKSACELQEL